MERPSSAPEHKGSIVAGIALLVLGLVVFIPSGLCTGVVAYGPIAASLTRPGQAGAWTAAFVPLIIGGPFVVGGFAMIRYGAKELIAYFSKRG